MRLKINKFEQIQLLSPWKYPNILPSKKDIPQYTLENRWAIQFVGWSKDFVGKRWFFLIVWKGFVCDGQSTPWWLWWFMRPDGNVRLAALAHDAAYRTAGFLIKKHLGCTLWCSETPLIEDSGKVILSRLASDQLYKYLYKQSTEGRRSRAKAQLGYAVLRKFGDKYFGAEPPNLSREV